MKSVDRAFVEGAHLVGVARALVARSRARHRRFACWRRDRGGADLRGSRARRGRRRPVQRDERARASRPSRCVRRALERVRSVHLHLELEAAVLRAVHQPERQQSLAPHPWRAQLLRHLHRVPRRQAVEGRRGVRGAGDHLAQAAVAPDRPRERHPERRAAEDRRRDAGAVHVARLPAADLRPRGRAAPPRLRTDAAGLDDQATAHRGAHRRFQRPRLPRQEQLRRRPAAAVHEHGLPHLLGLRLRRRRARLRLRRRGRAVVGRLHRPRQPSHRPGAPEPGDDRLPPRRVLRRPDRARAPPPDRRQGRRGAHPRVSQP